MPSTSESAHALTLGCADPGARPAMGVHSKGVADSPCSRLRSRGKAHRGRGRTGQMPPKLISPSVWPLATYAQRVGVPIAVALALDAKLAEFPIHYATLRDADTLPSNTTSPHPMQEPHSFCPCHAPTVGCGGCASSVSPEPFTPSFIKRELLHWVGE